MKERTSFSLLHLNYIYKSKDKIKKKFHSIIQLNLFIIKILRKFKVGIGVDRGMKNDNGI